MTTWGITFAVAVPLACVPALAHAQSGALKPNDNRYEFEHALTYTKIGKDGERKQKKAFDISGIACVVLKKDERRCLVVNDEGDEAHVVKIEGFEIEPKDPITLLDAAPDAKAVRSLFDKIGCEGGTSADLEFDGEGVAYAPGFFYVVGSHGCGRKKDAFKPSSMVLARIPVDDRGKPKGAVETTFRLGQALVKADKVGIHALQSLNESRKGLNVEGIAVIGDTLFAGLRAPNLAGKAYLVAVPRAGLFPSDREPFDGSSKVIGLEVGEGAGIRDLAVTDKGRLIVLTGPAEEQPGVPAKIFVFDPARGGPAQLRAVLKDLEDDERCGKAEAVTPIGPDRVLVFFDGLKNGGPREYGVSLD